MPCEIVKLPGGGTAIVRHGNRRFPRCKFCGTCDATMLCDFIVAKTHGGAAITCDRPICVHCARQVGEMDFCPRHSG